MTKDDCLDFLVRNLAKTGRWRQSQARRWPDDPRNGRAGTRLAELAAGATDISDTQWAVIGPRFVASNPDWIETVSDCCADVGFRTHPEDFPAFVQIVIDALAVPA